MRAIIVIASAAIVCTAILPAEVVDVRQALQASQKTADQDFPDGEHVKLTHFGHIGEISTAEGDKINVADQRGVITGMLAPRGLNYIVFFDAEYRYLGKLRYVSARPLWCEGSRVFLFGELDTPNGTGNVIDLARGWGKLSVESVDAYGSHQKANKPAHDNP